MWGRGINQDTHEIARRLAGFRVLAGLDRRTLRHIALAGQWFCLPGGAELERAGPTDRALFFVLSGTMTVQVEDGRGSLECVAHVPAGETVGEMSLLSDEPHSARLFAHRDTELFALSRPAFERVAKIHPDILRNLSLLLIDRLRRTTHRAAMRHAGRSVALIGTEARDDLLDLASQLVTALWSMGVRATCLDQSDAGRPADWYHAVEAEHDLVLYIAQHDEKKWWRQAERQADRIVLVGSETRAELSSNAVLVARATDRILLSSTASAAPRSDLKPIIGLRHVVRSGNRRDIARLARFLCGRAVGLVLSGGGARGFSQLGIVRALAEAGIPIDAVGGTSMGAIIAAGLASEWSFEEAAERMRAAFVRTNPISDVTVPTVAFFGGRKVRQLLHRNFGDARIEDLALPYFCVTSDLTDGVDAAHHSGLLAERLQASVALPGLLPPVVLDGHVHVDGGVMNNLPVEHMARITSGIIAVDVTGDTRLPPAGDGTPAPNILSILIRTGTVGNEFQRREAHRAASVLFEPPVGGIGFRDWQSFDRAVAIGHAHGLERLEREPELIEKLRLSGLRAAA